MLSYTHAVLFYSGTNQVEFYDEYFTEKKMSFSLPAGTADQMVYDEIHDKLWISNGANVLYRYGITEDGGGVPIATLEASISTALYFSDVNQYGDRMCVDEEDGTLFGACVQGYNNMSIFSVLVDGTTIENSVAVNPNYYGGSYSTNSSYYYRGSICYDQHKKTVMFFPRVAYNASTFIYENQGVSVLKITSDLTSVDYWTHCLYEDMPLYYNGSARYLPSNIAYNHMNMLEVANALSLSRDQTVAFNNATGRTIAPFKQSDRRIWSTDGNAFQKNYLVPDAKFENTTSQIACSKVTGDVFLSNAAGLVVCDYDMNIKDSRVHGSKYFYLNQYTDEYYIYDSVADIFTLYDKNGVKVISSAIGAFPSGITSMLVAPGSTSSVPGSVGLASIVYPDRSSAIQDTTPTLVVRVGESMTGWTQQFRVVADTDYDTVLMGGPDDAYMRVADSFANGSQYDASYNWDYSSDYIESNYDPATGTWAALGTADGLQSGGTEPTNGINCESPTTRYLKFTVPAADELTGAASNTKWYFKIFSYSA